MKREQCSKYHEFEVEFGKDAHLTPEHDIIVHEESTNCICDPVIVGYVPEACARVFQHTFIRQVLC